jgi:dihydrofolate reductase
MIISQIVAVANNNVIGKDNDLIWRLPADLKHFKNITMGHCMLMGRKNFDSIGRALPGRTTIIITRNKDYKIAGCHTVFSIEEGISLAKSLNEKELMIIGGGQIYEQSLGLTSKVYYTSVHETFDGDTFYPELSDTEWVLGNEEKHLGDEKNKHDYTFKEFIRK